METQDKRQQNRFVEWLNSLAEVSATVVPLLALMLGIGMVRLLPSKITTPLFYSEQDSQAFLEKAGMETVSDMPIVIVREGCGESCDKLRTDLAAHGLQYDEFSVESQYGKLFYDKAVEATGSSDLPKVIVGDSVVRADAPSVKQVVEKRSQAAQ